MCAYHSFALASPFFLLSSSIAIAARLNAIGASVYGFDQQGSGQSDGDRAYVERFEHYVQDACAFVAHIQNTRATDASVPQFLLGHSMGGLIVALVMQCTSTNTHAGSVDLPAEADSVALQSISQQYAGKVRQWTGCILSSPALAAHPHTATPLMVRLGKFFSDKLPKLQLLGLDVNGLSRYDTVNAHYQADPLNC